MASLPDLLTVVPAACAQGELFCTLIITGNQFIQSSNVPNSFGMLRNETRFFLCGANHRHVQLTSTVLSPTRAKVRLTAAQLQRAQFYEIKACNVTHVPHSYLFFWPFHSTQVRFAPMVLKFHVMSPDPHGMRILPTSPTIPEWDEDSSDMDLTWDNMESGGILVPTSTRDDLEDVTL